MWDRQKWEFRTSAGRTFACEKLYIYIYNIRKFVRAETGKNATLQLIIYIHRLKFAGDEIGRTATIVDNIYIYILTVNNKHMCRYI